MTDYYYNENKLNMLSVKLLFMTSFSFSYHAEKFSDDISCKMFSLLRYLNMTSIRFCTDNVSAEFPKFTFFSTVTTMKQNPINPLLCSKTLTNSKQFSPEN